MVQYRSFEIKLISACDLLDVRHLGLMKVYAKVSISRNLPGIVWTTPVDEDRETNPIWNYRIQTSIPEKLVQQEEGGKVAIVLYCDRTFLEDKYVGEVNISLKKLFDHGLARENIEYSVDRNNGKETFGTLKISYSFGESTENINVQKGSSSTTEQGPRTGISALQAVSLVADVIQIGEALSKVAEAIQGL